jgi:lipoprotein signal peptidase
VLGSVTDFFEFAFVEFPVFNVADMAIIGGVAVLALWILFPVDEEPETLAEEDASRVDDLASATEPPAQAGTPS